MKRIRLYSDEQINSSQANELAKDIASTFINLFEDIEDEAQNAADELSEQVSASRSRYDDNEQIDYFSISPKTKRKLISYYLRNKGRAYMFSKRRMSVDLYLQKLYYDLGKKLYSIESGGESVVSQLGEGCASPVWNRLTYKLLMGLGGGLVFGGLFIPYFAKSYFGITNTENLVYAGWATAAAGIITFLSGFAYPMLKRHSDAAALVEKIKSPLQNVTNAQELVNAIEKMRTEYRKYINGEIHVNPEIDMIIDEITSKRADYYVSIGLSIAKELKNEKILSAFDEVSFLIKVSYEDQSDNKQKGLWGKIANALDSAKNWLTGNKSAKGGANSTWKHEIISMNIKGRNVTINKSTRLILLAALSESVRVTVSQTQQASKEDTILAYDINYYEMLKELKLLDDYMINDIICVIAKQPKK